MRIVNLTPHPLNLCNEDGDCVVIIPPNGLVARMKATKSNSGTMFIGGRAFPVYETEIGPLEGLPAPEDGTLYVVSSIAGVAAKALGRTDVLIMDALVRDKDGKIIGAKGFAKPY